MIKNRNMLIQILLMLVTFGFYIIYWYHQTFKEMKHLTGSTDEPWLHTLLFCIPVVTLFAQYKHAEMYETISTEKINKWIVFLLWVVIPPVVWILVQLDLNRVAAHPSKNPDPPVDTF